MEERKGKQETGIGELLLSELDLPQDWETNTLPVVLDILKKLTPVPGAGLLDEYGSTSKLDTSGGNIFYQVGQVFRTGANSDILFRLISLSVSTKNPEDKDGNVTGMAHLTLNLRCAKDPVGNTYPVDGFCGAHTISLYEGPNLGTKVFIDWPNEDNKLGLTSLNLTHDLGNSASEVLAITFAKISEQVDSIVK